jgi:hypothetical protein
MSRLEAPRAAQANRTRQFGFETEGAAKTNGVAAAGPSARPLGRGGGIRTPDFELPKLALYQPELHPEAANPNTRFCARDCLCVAPQFTRGYHNAVSQNAPRDAAGPLACYQAPVHQPSTQAAFEIAAVEWVVILDLRRVRTRRTGPGTQVSICPLALHTKTHRMTSTRSPDLHLELHPELHLDLYPELHLELRARLAPEKSP